MSRQGRLTFPILMTDISWFWDLNDDILITSPYFWIAHDSLQSIFISTIILYIQQAQAVTMFQLFTAEETEAQRKKQTIQSDTAKNYRRKILSAVVLRFMTFLHYMLTPMFYE